MISIAIAAIRHGNVHPDEERVDALTQLFGDLSLSERDALRRLYIQEQGSVQVQRETGLSVSGEHFTE